MSTGRRLMSGTNPPEPLPAPSLTMTQQNELATSTDFAGLGVAPDLTAVLEEHGINEPFPIHPSITPEAVADRIRDLLGPA